MSIDDFIDNRWDRECVKCGTRWQESDNGPDCPMCERRNLHNPDQLQAELSALRSQVERYRENCKKLAADAGDAMTRESESLREVERYREVVTFALGVLRSSTMTWEQRGAVTYDALARLDADPPREPTERNEG